MDLYSTPTQWPKQLPTNKKKSPWRLSHPIEEENSLSAAGNVLEVSVVSLTVPGPVGQGFGETAGLGLWAQRSMFKQLLGELLSLSVPPLLYLYREVMLMHLPPKHTFNKQRVWKNPHKKQIPPKPWLCRLSHLSGLEEEKARKDQWVGSAVLWETFSFSFRNHFKTEGQKKILGHINGKKIQGCLVSIIWKKKGLCTRQWS